MESTKSYGVQCEEILANANSKKDLPFSLTSHLNNHGHSQDFLKGGSHFVKQRVLAFSQPEYCRSLE